MLSAGGDLKPSDIYARIRESYWTRNKQGIYRAAAAMLKNSKEYSATLKYLAKYYDNPAGYGAIPVSDTAAAVSVFRRYGRVEPRGALSELKSFTEKYHPSENDVSRIKKAICDIVDGQCQLLVFVILVEVVVVKVGAFLCCNNLAHQLYGGVVAPAVAPTPTAHSNLAKLVTV